MEILRDVCDNIFNFDMSVTLIFRKCYCSFVILKK